MPKDGSLPQFHALTALRVLTCLVAWLVAFPVLARAHKLRVQDAGEAKTLLANGAKVVGDYGTFQIIQADDAAVAALKNRRAELKDEFDTIFLNARHLDTTSPEIKSLRKSVGAFSGKKLHLVHFVGPPRPEWAAALEKAGVRIVSYIPNNAYLLFGDATALQMVQAMAAKADYVQWEGEYTGDYKIHPGARTVDALGNIRDIGTDTFSVQLVDDKDLNRATLALIDGMKLAPIKRQARSLQYLNLVVRLPAARLGEIAARPEVVSIQPYFEPHKLDERQDQIVAGNISGNGLTGPGYLAWLAGKGFSQEQFDASGFVVDVSDSGIDNGTTAPGHFGLYKNGNVSDASRVAYSRLEGTPNPNSTLQGCDGHGTLNTHIIGGYNDWPSGFPHVDAEGYRYGLGICPFTRVGASVLFDPDNFTDPNYVDLQSRAYRDSARISNNSWGDTTGSGAYDWQAQTFDALVRDAQPSTAAVVGSGNQQMVIVFSAGNEGPSGGTNGTITTPGTAKNVITVGAAENVRSLSTTNGGTDTLGKDGCSLADSVANSVNDIAPFSSRGPCSDGRMKPEIVAPGTHITGGVPQISPPPSPGSAGSALPCFNADGICALQGSGVSGSPDNFFPLNEQFYTESSGTSHSTPAVAGACALVRQYFINRSLSPPSPAMTKAFLVNSARYMTGVSANDTLWSKAQGMGEMNLGMAFDDIPRLLRDQGTDDKFTAAGQTRTFAGTVVDSTKPLRVTLAWTDAPGNTTGNAFNNDLDLTVTIGGNTYKGNVFNGAFSTTGGSADGKNNLESVCLPPGISGNFTVTVTAANINSDGVPNEAPSLDQDFALVIYNVTPAPAFIVDGYTLVSETCLPTNGTVDPGETVTMSFALRDTGSENTTNLTATLLATNGVFAPSGPQTYGALVAAGAPVSQSFSFIAIGSCGDIITPTFQLQDNGVDLGTVRVSMVLGAVSLRSSFTSTNRIAIPAVGTSGVAGPYPSTISVSGVGGVVSKVTATVSNLSHTFPDDVEILLVGPDGKDVLLMSRCGFNNSMTNITLTFDDDAAASLPQRTVIASGAYKPTSYTTPVPFPAPAPAAPFGQTMSLFNNTNPNGDWSLYIQDIATGDYGAIAGGWSLSITTSNILCCSQAVAPPQMHASISSDNQITISWDAMPGHTYRLQYKNDLLEANWTNVAGDVIASGTTASRTDTMGGASRFYRVVVVQ